MPGAQPRRSPDRRDSSAIRRQATVGLGTPGVARVRRRPDNAERDVPPGGTLHYYGAMRVGIGAASGTVVGPSGGIVVFQGTPSDDFQNGAAAEWVEADGEFAVTSPGYWAIWADVVIGTVDPMDTGYLEIVQSYVGNIRIPMFNNGSTLRASAQIGPGPAFEGDTLQVIANLDTSPSAVISGGQALIWPTGLYPEVSP